MTKHANTAITLHQWNILILPTEEEIFVGLRHRPETIPPFQPPAEDDEILPFMLNNSNPITEFDNKTGIGYTDNGTRYVVLGKPSDPTGFIRNSVAQMMQEKSINWKYDFLE